MELELRFFANFREAVGQKTLVRDYDGDERVGDVLHALEAEYPEMDLFESDGSVRDYISILKNGRDITHIDGLETALDDGDTVSIFPPVAGGDH